MYSTKKIGNGTELYEFQGPGLGYYGSYPTEILSGGALQAEAIARMLGKAFAAGRRSKLVEIRKVLESDG